MTWWRPQEFPIKCIIIVPVHIYTYLFVCRILLKIDQNAVWETHTHTRNNNAIHVALCLHVCMCLISISINATCSTIQCVFLLGPLETYTMRDVKLGRCGLAMRDQHTSCFHLLFGSFPGWLPPQLAHFPHLGHNQWPGEWWQKLVIVIPPQVKNKLNYMKCKYWLQQRANRPN